MRIVEQHDPVLAGGAMVSLAGELAGYRDELRRFARRRVRDDALAEDAVQDALVAALQSLPSFQGDSSLKTWLHGILAHKIQDAFRREMRYVRLAVADEAPAEGREEAAECPSAAMVSQDDPVREVRRRRFGASLRLAIEGLPASLREVFQLQAVEGLATEEVCRRLRISEGNCWVRLHRARKLLATKLAGHY